MMEPKREQRVRMTSHEVNYSRFYFYRSQGGFIISQQKTGQKAYFGCIESTSKKSCFLAICMYGVHSLKCKFGNRITIFRIKAYSVGVKKECYQKKENILTLKLFSLHRLSYVTYVVRLTINIARHVICVNLYSRKEKTYFVCVFLLGQF